MGVTDMRATLLVSSFAVFTVRGRPGADVDHEDDSYEYDETPPQPMETTGEGDRLVGGKLGNIVQYPFIVGFTASGNNRATQCTGSLITPTWVLTAAHCNDIISPGFETDLEKLEVARKNCVEKTKAGKKFKIKPPRGLEFLLQCRYLKETNAFEVISEPPGTVWGGVNNVNQTGEPK